MIMNFLIPIVLTRYLTKEDFGIYAQFMVILQFSLGFFSLGFQSSLYYYYPTADSAKRRVLIVNAIGLLLILFVIAIVVLKIPFIGSFIFRNSGVSGFFLFFAFAFFFGLFTILLQVLYILKSDLKTSLLYPPLSETIKAITVVVFVLYFSGINSVLTGLVVSYFLFFLFTLFYLFKRIRENRGSSFFNLKVLKQQLSYSLPLGLASTTRILSQRIDRLVSISYLSKSAFATYSIAFYGVPGIRQIYDSLSKVFIIKMTTEYQEGKTDQMVKTYKSMVAKNLSYTIPIMLSVLLFSKTIIVFLFTDKYLDSVLYFQIYLFSFLFSSFGNGLVLRATNNTKYSFRSYLISAIITIPITFVLIQKYAINGAIVSAMLNVILPRLLLSYYDITVTNSSLKHFFPWSKFGIISLVSLGVIFPVFVLKSFIDINIYWVILFSSVYLIVVFVIEIRMNVFVVDKKSVLSKLKSQRFINKYF